MFLRRFTDFVLQGRVQAMTTAFLFAYIPFVGVVSILIAALVTLRKGMWEGLFVTAAATFPYFLMYAVHPAPSEIVLIGILIACNLLTWLFAIVLRQYGNWSLTLDLALVLGVIVIGAVHFIYPDIQAWWSTHLTDYLNRSIDVVGQLEVQKPDGSQEMFADVVMTVKRYASGFVMVSILFNALLQLVLARWWQAAMFNPGGLRKELCHVRLSFVTGLVFIATAALAFFENATAVDMMPVLYGIYSAAGLSLLHNILGLTKAGWLWLTLVYIGVIVLFPLGIMIVAVIGLMDTGINFRKRLHI
jgi:hypothetical protein